MNNMKKLNSMTSTLLTLGLLGSLSAVSFAEGERTSLGRVDHRAEEEQLITDEAALMGFTGQRAYGNARVVGQSATSGTIVMSDAHLDAKKFLDWVRKGKPANHPFMRTYEGANFNKFIDAIPERLAAKKLGNPGVNSVDIVWGGDPFDRGIFESLPMDERKEAFRAFARELKGMKKVDGINYNFVASLGDHEVMKVNRVWDNAAVWKSAKLNGQMTASQRMAGLKKAAIEQLAEKRISQMMFKGEIASDFTKASMKLRKAKLKELVKAIQQNPRDMELVNRVAKGRYRALGRTTIDIPKVQLGSLDDLNKLPDDVLRRLKDMDMDAGGSLYDALVKEINMRPNSGMGATLTANDNPVHREILEKYGKVNDDLNGLLFNDELTNQAKVKGLANADEMGGFMRTSARPIGQDEAKFLKRNGVKPSARARQLNGIDDQLQITKYSDQFADVFDSEGFQIERRSYSPYEATVKTRADGRQYAHRHVQYGNLDNALLEQKQFDKIVSHNLGGNRRVPYPDMRLKLSEPQIEKFKKMGVDLPESMLGKTDLTDDVLRQVEDIAKAGGKHADDAKALLSTTGGGLFDGQRVTMNMTSATADGMRNSGMVIPGRTDVLENAGQQAIGQHLQAENGRIVQNHSKTTMGRSSAGDVTRVNNMDANAALWTSDTHNPSINFAAATDPETAKAIDQLCPGCAGTRPEINSGSMSASAKNPGRPNTIGMQFGDEMAEHLQIDPDDGKVKYFDALPDEQRKWVTDLHKARAQGDDEFVRFLMDPKTGKDPLTGRSMLGDDPVDALRNILPCK